MLLRGKTHLLVLAPGLLCKSLGQRRVISDDDVVEQSARFNLYIEKQKKSITVMSFWTRERKIWLSNTDLPQLNANVLQAVEGVNVWIILKICDAQELDSALTFYSLRSFLFVAF
jgi:hypothetical protein